MTKWKQLMAAGMVATAVTFGVAGCTEKDESPVEEAGKDVGNALENIGDAVEDAGETVKEKTEN
jgi:hypothetical protein